MRILPKILGTFLLIALLTACSKPTPTVTTEPATPVVITTEAPTATELPMALRINGEGILLSDYNAEMIRLQMALTELNKEMTPEEQKEKLITGFIDEVLLAQAAAQAGFSVSDAEVQSRIDKLATEIGGVEKLREWQAKYNYTDDSFKNYLKRSILAAWQRDQIIDSVPTTAEQIHARQILYQDEGNALDVYNKLQNGADFASLASLQDPILGGDLGWFPRGTLTQPEVEEAVFALKAGEVSGVIKSALGYHIIKVIERDPVRELSVEARRRLQEQKLDEWLQASRAVSTIEILVP